MVQQAIIEPPDESAPRVNTTYRLIDPPVWATHWGIGFFVTHFNGQDLPTPVEIPAVVGRIDAVLTLDIPLNGAGFWVLGTFELSSDGTEVIRQENQRFPPGDVLTEIDGAFHLEVPWDAPPLGNGGNGGNGGSNMTILLVLGGLALAVVLAGKK